MAMPTAHARTHNSTTSGSFAQTGSHHHLVHTAASHRRPSFTRRPARPAFKRNSSHNKSKRVSIEDPLSLDIPSDDNMAASFLQYCTVCESQIITPSNSILYCSEACRRKDTNKPLTSSSPSIGSHHQHSPQSPPMTPSGSYKDLRSLDGPVRDILPQRSPTAITPNRFSYTSLSSAADSELEPYDQDAGESSDQGNNLAVKPKRPSMASRSDSEAARYLRQFQSPSMQAEPSSRLPKRHSLKGRSRSSAGNSISLSGTSSMTPSPGTSPSSSGPTPNERQFDRKSSIGAVSAVHVTSSSLHMLSNGGAGGGTSVPYGYPLPPRTNPFYSSSYGAKNISLVTPLLPSALEREGKGVDSSSSWSGHRSQLTQQLAQARAGGINSSGIGGAVSAFDLSSMQASLPGLKGRPTTATSIGGMDELHNNSATTSTGPEEIIYEKRAMNLASSAPSGSGKGTLKSLFQFEEMQAAPTS